MFKRHIAFFMCMTLIASNNQLAYAQDFNIDQLPVPGAMVSVGPSFEPALIRGLTVHKNNPFLFDFIVDPGQSKVSRAVLKDEVDQMVKYFFASLTIPDKDIWVNLSPYEKDRMIPEVLGQTAMGRDLLAQDYMLKQLTASLIHPQKALGKLFWAKVYAKAKEMYGTTQVPVNTFNKVWIIPQSVGIYEHGQTAFIVNGHLKVMLEEDYLSLKKHFAITATPTRGHVPLTAGKGYMPRAYPIANLMPVYRSSDRPNTLSQGTNQPANAIASQIIKQVILPEIEKEVNDGKNFATLRQIFFAQALAVWFKRNLKQALLNRVYANKGTVKGIDQNDAKTNEAIYQQYLKAYKKGVFNFIQEDMDPVTQEALPRKYFSGGYFGADMGQYSTEPSKAQVSSTYDRAEVVLETERPKRNIGESPVPLTANQIESQRNALEALPGLGDHFIATAINLTLRKAVWGDEYWGEAVDGEQILRSIRYSLKNPYYPKIDPNKIDQKHGLQELLLPHDEDIRKDHIGFWIEFAKQINTFEDLRKNRHASWIEWAQVINAFVDVKGPSGKLHPGQRVKIPKNAVVSFTGGQLTVRFDVHYNQDDPKTPPIQITDYREDLISFWPGSNTMRDTNGSQKRCLLGEEEKDIAELYIDNGDLYVRNNGTKESVLSFRFLNKAMVSETASASRQRMKPDAAMDGEVKPYVPKIVIEENLVRELLDLSTALEIYSNDRILRTIYLFLNTTLSYTIIENNELLLSFFSTARSANETAKTYLAKLIELRDNIQNLSFWKKRKMGKTLSTIKQQIEFMKNLITATNTETIPEEEQDLYFYKYLIKEISAPKDVFLSKARTVFSFFHAATSLKFNYEFIKESEPALANLAMTADEIKRNLPAKKDKAQVVTWTQGGIDLSQQDAAMHVVKDANGGVTVDIDPDLIARVKREGLSRAYPVVIDLQPASAQSIFGGFSRR